MVLIILGTNFYHVNTISYVMPHVHLFVLYCAVILLTHKWHKNPNWKLSLFLGAILGLMVISRPTEIVAAIIPVFWGVKGLKSFIKKYKELFQKHFKLLFLIAFAFGFVVFFQMIYWKMITGYWVYYTYNNPGEGLELFSPFTKSFLFSFRKGWFIYTPIALFAIAGFIWVYRKKRELFIPLLLFTALNIYLVSSWSTWWYAACFSQRAMTQSYPILAILLAFFIDASLGSKKALKVSSLTVLFILLFFNQFQTWQYNHGIISQDRMTQKYYWLVFGKTEVPKGATRYLLVDRGAGNRELFTDPQNYNFHELKKEGFEKPQNLEHYSIDTVHRGNYAYRLSEVNDFSPNQTWKFNDLTETDHAWIKTGFWVYLTDSSQAENLMLVCTFSHKEYTYKYRTYKMMEIDSAVSLNEWKYYEVDYLTPEVRRKSDPLDIYFWFTGEGNVYVDDMRFLSYIRKW
jgi:hypothetical protein